MAYTPGKALQSRASLLAKSRHGNSDKGMESEKEVLSAVTAVIEKSMSDVNGVWAGINTEFKNYLFKGNFSNSVPLSTGLVPYDLERLSLVFPVSSKWRDILPRTKAAGLLHRGKLITATAGSNGVAVDAFRSELTLGTFPTAPVDLGDDSAVDFSVNQKFIQVDASASLWAQWAAQGYEDLEALAALELNAQYVMAESQGLVAGTGYVLSTPSAPTVTPRTALSNETVQTGVTTNVSVKVCAKNAFGRTVVSSAGTGSWSSGDVTDVILTGVAGATHYDIFVGTGASPSTWYLAISNSPVSGHNFGGTTITLQGAMPSSGNTSAQSDAGTGTGEYAIAVGGEHSLNRFEGVISVLSGHAQANSGTGYPSGHQASFINQNVNDTLNINSLTNGLSSLYAGGYLAVPSRVITTPKDRTNLSKSILNNSGGGGSYRITLDEVAVGNVRAGTIVSSFIHPDKGTDVAIELDPFMNQGTAILWSDVTPDTTLRSAVCADISELQPQVLFNWASIDAARRMSMIGAETLVMRAPMFDGLLQGLNPQ